jgi:lysophospholipase L1-like esterase
MILGDSIAQGIANNRPECVAYVRSGINSYDWNTLHMHRDLSADTVVISLGSNDHGRIHTFAELLALRQSIGAKRVFWIVPAIKPNVQDIVYIVAKNFKDIILEIPEVSKDNVHPTTRAYKELANITRGNRGKSN